MTSILNAAAILAAAERPVIVAGAGAVASGAHQELVKLAEKLSIPVGTTPSGKEMILEDHPLAIGVVGSYGRWSSNKIVQEADVVFFAGSSAGDLATAAWKVPGPGANVIHLNIDPTVIGKHYPAKVALVGDAKATLSRFIEVSKPSQPRTAWVSRAQDLLRKWRDEIAPMGDSDESPMRPERLCKEISEWLPSNAVVVSDTGHAAIWSATMIGLKHADQRYIRCAGTLGWGLPGAMGVKCALPDRPVVCFTGDGGLWYHIGELETAARAGINIIVVVNNNSCLQQVIKGFNAAYGGASNTGKARVMWYFQETNFAKIAENMGCIGIRVERPHDLKEAFNRALKANKPVVIDVVSDDQAAPTWG
jgi:acetolactate synthase-1/2/3 large subunit